MKELFKLGLVACDIVPTKQAEKLAHPVELAISFPHRKATILFRSIEDKEAFLKVGVHWGVSRFSGERILDYKQDVLGLYLGYPPQAVNSFVRGDTDCTMFFGGTGFRARYSDLEENLRYLRMNYGSTGFKCGVKLDSSSKNQSPIIYSIS